MLRAKLSPGQPFFGICTPAEHFIDGQPPAGFVVVATLSDGRQVCHISARQDEAEGHIPYCGECYQTKAEVYAAWPELNTTKTVDDGEGGTVEVPAMKPHSFGTKYEQT